MYKFSTLQRDRQDTRTSIVDALASVEELNYVYAELADDLKSLEEVQTIMDNIHQSINLIYQFGDNAIPVLNLDKSLEALTGMEEKLITARVAAEGLGEALKNGFNAFIDFIINIWHKITGVFSKSVADTSKGEQAAKTIEDNVNDQKKAEKAENATVPEGTLTPQGFEQTGDVLEEREQLEQETQQTQEELQKEVEKAENAKPDSPEAKASAERLKALLEKVKGLKTKFDGLTTKIKEIKDMFTVRTKDATFKSVGWTRDKIKSCAQTYRTKWVPIFKKFGSYLATKGVQTLNWIKDKKSKLVFLVNKTISDAQQKHRGNQMMKQIKEAAAKDQAEGSNDLLAMIRANMTGITKTNAEQVKITTEAKSSMEKLLEIYAARMQVDEM